MQFWSVTSLRSLRRPLAGSVLLALGLGLSREGCAALALAGLGGPPEPRLPTHIFQRAPKNDSEIFSWPYPFWLGVEARGPWPRPLPPLPALQLEVMFPRLTDFVRTLFL